MFIVAASTIGEVIGLALGLLGASSLVFAAFRFRRDDTTAIVQQQSTIVHDMQALTAELRSALEECERRAGHG